jgi:hypothetical protein
MGGGPHERQPVAQGGERLVGPLEWVNRYGFTLFAGVVLLVVILYYTRVLDERSYQNAIQLQQVNAKLDTVTHQLTRLELAHAGGEGGR